MAARQCQLCLLAAELPGFFAFRKSSRLPVGFKLMASFCAASAPSFKFASFRATRISFHGSSDCRLPESESR